MRDSFYARWIIANCWSEGLGLSATLLLGVLAASYLNADPGPLAQILAAVLAVVLGTALEGALVGVAQGRVLERAAPALTLRRWTLATMLGASSAWLLGMLPSALIGLYRSGPDGAAPPSEPPALLQYGLAVVMGLVLGVVLGYPQMLALRGVAAKPSRWLLANALAWGVGMPLVFVGMDQVPWSGPIGSIAGGIALTCFAVGAAVGAVHGAFLRRMLPARRASPPSEPPLIEREPDRTRR